MNIIVAMGERTVNPYRLLSVTVVICVLLLCQIGTVSAEESSPELVDQSSVKIDVVDGGHCLFRGEMKQHRQDWKIDACTECTCLNGTTDCNIISCGAPICSAPVSIPGECCVQCPYELVDHSSVRIDVVDGGHCLFRGEMKQHRQVWKIDACTECTCLNGTTDCNIISCGAPICSAPISIPGECCLQCPYVLDFFGLFNRFNAGTGITERKIHKFKFSAEIEVYKRYTSRIIQGENMWRLGAWVSRNSDGTGRKFSYVDNVLSETQMKQENSKKDYGWEFNNLRFSFDATDGVCSDFNYFCIKFNMTDKPLPALGLDFIYTVFRQEYEREINCVRLGKCKDLNCVKPPPEGSCCQRFGLNGNHDSDVVITASTSYNNDTAYGPGRAALFTKDDDGGIGGWGAGVNDAHQWIQVDFGIPHKVTGVLLQGREDDDQWVTSFRILFSIDGEIFYSTPTLEGTFDRHTVARRYFDRLIFARYIRLNPITWQARVAVRFDLLGC